MIYCSSNTIQSSEYFNSFFLNVLGDISRSAKKRFVAKAKDLLRQMPPCEIFFYFYSCFFFTRSIFLFLHFSRFFCCCSCFLFCFVLFYFFFLSLIFASRSLKISENFPGMIKLLQTLVFTIAVVDKKIIKS